MDESEPSAVTQNPFCTRCVRPGAAPFLFPAGENADKLVERLRQSGWWAEITGAHGSGKSALLATLIPAIERAGSSTVLVELHDGQRRMPIHLTGDSRLHPPAVLLVDGYEQLSGWSRWLLKRFCRWRGVGLLVTVHRPAGFETLYSTAPTPSLAEQIVDRLLGGREWPFTSEELRDRFSRHGGDLRETLFDLYDLYEQRRGSAGGM